MVPRVWILLAVLAGGCSGLRVSHDYDPAQDFSKLQTWCWAPEPPQADGSEFTMVSSLSHDRIRGAVAGELAKRNYRQVEPDAADFWVREYAAIGQQLEVDPGYGFYDMDGRYARIHDEGTIMVDIITPKEKRLVWRGTARGALDTDLTPKERERQIREAVAEILQEFPPKK